MTSEEQIAGLRQMSENGMLYGPGTRRALALAADTIERLERENAELEQQVERLREDAARLDWLADPNQAIGNIQLPNDCVLDNLHSLRDAIDAARSR